MSASSLSEFETGKSRPNEARLTALSDVLEVPVPAVDPELGVPDFTHWREYEQLEVDPVSRAGLEMFVERGYHGSTVRMIAGRCGMTVAGVYHHVPSKHDLLMRLMRRAMADMVDRCVAADAEGASPRERLANLTESLVRFHVFRIDWGYLATNEIRALAGDARAEMIVERRRVRQLLQDAVADCRAGSREREHVPAVVTARAVVTMCVAIPDWYDDAGRPDADELVEQYVALALGMA
jgi:AcrR family transcriptional regulator